MRRYRVSSQEPGPIDSDAFLHERSQEVRDGLDSETVDDTVWEDKPLPVTTPDNCLFCNVGKATMTVAVIVAAWGAGYLIGTGLNWVMSRND